ncbi:MAG TPA: dTDP-4-dehydrorhamnose reductase [Candidatus Diapherotrites archaeon]|uniref:dTDP-4-dehydrorhamnose reductase n=1 Tax=Candidatus Iainarchaeum sp. TaxID=3101447 RepID=A0A7J4JFD7_9ARCH|nr:dTDP-4-dehydrorhamnose reductase [Candidatus Diapherotrites archaeon]HIH16482.1 dTDP-4-dehydrorhamnose reductase [Candidatus Diapherotrites archaeon]
MHRILVTGAKGFLGKKACTVFKAKGLEVVEADLPELDVTREDRVREFVAAARPEAVIHAAALTDVDGCETARKRAFKVNVVGTQNVARACRAVGAKMVFISTDFVFDGKKRGAYTEADVPRPLNYYAQTKAEGEEAVKRLAGDWVIVRTGVLYGFNDAGDKTTFAHWALKKLGEGREFRVVDDQFAQPTLVDDLVEGIHRLLEENAAGVFNLTGSEYLSRLAFVKKVASVFGFKPGQAKPLKTAELKQAALRPLKLRTSHAKIRKLGIRMSSVLQGLKEMRRQMNA